MFLLTALKPDVRFCVFVSLHVWSTFICLYACMCYVYLHCARHVCYALVSGGGGVGWGGGMFTFMWSCTCHGCFACAESTHRQNWQLLEASQKLPPSQPLDKEWPKQGCHDVVTCMAVALWKEKRHAVEREKETAAVLRAQWSDLRFEKMKFRTSPLLVFAGFCAFLMIFWSTFCITKCLFSISQNHHFRMVFAMNPEQRFCWRAKTHEQFWIRRDVYDIYDVNDVYDI